MSLPTLVDTPALVTVVATSPLTHRCPHVDEVDYGTVEISWDTAGKTIELHSLRSWLQSFSDVVVSHEQITDLIADELSKLEGVERVTAKTSWRTAGMDVRCSI